MFTFLKLKFKFQTSAEFNFILKQPLEHTFRDVLVPWLMYSPKLFHRSKSATYLSMLVQAACPASDGQTSPDVDKAMSLNIGLPQSRVKW